MKLSTIIIILAMLVPLVHAGRLPRPHNTPSAACEIIYNTPWQNIVAGGVAGGALITAYKVGSGLEEGLQTVARESPETFGLHFEWATRLFQIVVVIAIVFGVHVLIKYWRE